MQTSRFDRSLLPPAVSFYERELGRLRRRDRKGWALGNCPFHKSESRRSFSVNLQSGGFHCFGCGAKGGDIVQFIVLRDGLDFKTAAKTLGAWHGQLSPAERLDATRRQQEREWNLEQEAERKAAVRRERLRLRDELHTATRLYEQAASRLHERGPEAEDQWAVLPALLADLRLTESAYMQACGLEDPYRI